MQEDIRQQAPGLWSRQPVRELTHQQMVNCLSLMRVTYRERCHRVERIRVDFSRDEGQY